MQGGADHRRFSWSTIWAAAVSLVVTMAATILLGGSAGASPTATLVFSVDGGTTWSANVNAAPGQTVLARQYYDNDSNGTMAGVSITTSIPGGFTRVPGSTEVCLNPGTTDPTSPAGELACNTDADQGGPIDEAAVWSGSNLAISPTAGLLTQSTSATSGLLQVGQPRYLNLDQCMYFGSALDHLTYVVDSTANTAERTGTGTSNTAAASQTCGPGAGAYPYEPLNSGIANVPLLGHRYFNLDQCSYVTPGDAFTYFVGRVGNPRFAAGTTASNSTPSTPTCGAGAGTFAPNPLNSGVANIDLLGATTLNLEQCVYYGSGTDALTYAVPMTPNAPFGASTGASSADVSAPTCKPGAGAYPYQAVNSGVTNIDLIDSSRGQGFVQFAMVAPSPDTTTTYHEDGQLNGAGTGNPTGSGTITVDAAVGTPLGSPLLAGGVVGAGLLAGGWAHRRRGQRA
jgi:hypothetical protein